METRRASESYKGGLKHLVSDIGMSEANLHRCLNNNKIQAGDLEIASLLGVSILTFFDEKPVDNKDAQINKLLEILMNK